MAQRRLHRPRLLLQALRQRQRLHLRLHPGKVVPAAETVAAPTKAHLIWTSFGVISIASWAACLAATNKRREVASPIGIVITKTTVTTAAVAETMAASSLT